VILRRHGTKLKRMKRRVCESERKTFGLLVAEWVRFWARCGGARVGEHSECADPPWSELTVRSRHAFLTMSV
jgi:hypothetical protein